MPPVTNQIIKQFENIIFIVNPICWHGICKTINRYAGLGIESYAINNPIALILILFLFRRLRCYQLIKRACQQHTPIANQGGNWMNPQHCV
jgi:hypothetical protein